MLYCVLSFVGLRWNSFYFSIHLLDFVMNFKLLRTVMKSVLHNGKQVGGCGQWVWPMVEPENDFTFMCLFLFVYVFVAGHDGAHDVRGDLYLHGHCLQLL